MRAHRQLPRGSELPVRHLPGAHVPDVRRGAIVEIVPAHGYRWIAVFHRGPKKSPPAARDHLIGWPDEQSLCFVGGGSAYVVRTDDPDQLLDIFDGDTWPVTGVGVSAEHGLVVFSDALGLVAYGGDGKVWQTPRLAWYGLEVIGVKRDRVMVRGYDAPSGSYPEFEVDLRTGVASGAPYDIIDW